MAANPIGIVVDGKVELPEEAKSDPRFREGAKLRLVPVAPIADADNLQPADKPWDEWQKLAGSWGQVDVDPNAILDAERRKELEDEARWRD